MTGTPLSSAFARMMSLGRVPVRTSAAHPALQGTIAGRPGRRRNRTATSFCRLKNVTKFSTCMVSDQKWTTSLLAWWTWTPSAAQCPCQIAGPHGAHEGSWGMMPSTFTPRRMRKGEIRFRLLSEVLRHYVQDDDAGEASPRRPWLAAR
jgi:hypothetical protein